MLGEQEVSSCPSCRGIGGSVEDETGPGQCRDRESVPAGEHLVVERRRALLAATLSVESVVAALDPLAGDGALRVLSARKPAAGKLQDLEQKPGNTLSHAARPRFGGEGPSLRIELQQLGVVVEHAFVVRVAPVPVDGVAKEPSLDGVAQRRRAHALECAQCELLPGGLVEQKPERGRDRKLRRTTETAEEIVFIGGKLGDRGGERWPVRQRVDAGQLLRRLGERLGNLGGAVGHGRTTGGPSIRHGLQHHAKRRMPTPARPSRLRPRSLPRSRGWDRPRRKVGAGVESLPLGGDEHVERPAEALDEGTRRGEVTCVNVGMLFTVHLDADEVCVQVRGEHGIAETLACHDVAPVTGGVSNRHEHRHIARAGRSKGLRSPEIPVDGVLGV